MKKVKIIDLKKIENRINTLQQKLSRLEFSTFFSQYAGQRDIYEVLGYNKNPTFSDFYARYLQQDIVRAVIDKLCNYTWRGDVSIFNVNEEDKDKDSLYKWWLDVDKKLNIKAKFLRADKLAMLGNYSCILLGFDDVKQNSDFEKPVKYNSNLVYITPYSQLSCQILEYENKINSERYGKPLYYTINIKNGISELTLKVHYTRILHIVYDKLESEIEGIPFLLSIYHRLEDLDKIIGGSAEMFWRGARPGYYAQLNNDIQIEDDNLLTKKLEENLTKFEHDLRRFIAAQGIDKIESLQQQIADPTNFVSIQFDLICAITGIPKRILFGSERGELASSQDKETFNEIINARRKNFAEPEIVNNFLQRMIELQVIKQNEYTVEWMRVYDEDINQRSERALKITQAINTFTANPYNEEFMPKKTFMRLILGFTDEQIEEITTDLEKINETIFEKERKTNLEME